MRAKRIFAVDASSFRRRPGYPSLFHKLTSACADFFHQTLQNSNSTQV